MAPSRDRLVLASASSARAAMLTAAGLVFTVAPAAVDEAAAKHQARAAGHRAIDCALRLAEMKAAAVAENYPDALVIGADQILVAGEDWFDKPADLAAARAQLQALRGRTHELATAACAVLRGERVWQAQVAPLLAMRRFSDAFLDDYLDAERAAVLGSVGAYRLEGRGIQLFSRVEGDHFAILGLPLMELLDFLRRCGALAC